MWSYVAIQGALACRACELLCFVLADHGWGRPYTQAIIHACDFGGRYSALRDCSIVIALSELFAIGFLTLVTALAEPLLRAAMVACILPEDGGALQGALSAGLLITMRGIGPWIMGAYHVQHILLLLCGITPLLLMAHSSSLQGCFSGRRHLRHRSFSRRCASSWRVPWRATMAGTSSRAV